MGSVMDQERPWEREEKPEATTMRERIKDAYTRGGGNRSGLEPVMEQIIKELERLEALTAYPSPQPIAALEPAPDLASENDRLRAALEFYANPDIYKPHPHGPAFDRRDLSFHAKAALERKP